METNTIKPDQTASFTMSSVIWVHILCNTGYLKSICRPELVWFDSLRPINILSFKQLKDHNAVTPVRLEPAAPRSREQITEVEGCGGKVSVKE